MDFNRDLEIPVDVGDSRGHASPVKGKYRDLTGTRREDFPYVQT